MITIARLSTWSKSFQQQDDSEAEKLQQELRDAMESIQTAQNHLDHVTDPELIDCCIYQFNAAQLHYQVLLRQLRQQNSHISSTRNQLPDMPSEQENKKESCTAASL